MWQPLMSVLWREGRHRLGEVSPTVPLQQVICQRRKWAGAVRRACKCGINFPGSEIFSEDRDAQIAGTHDDAQVRLSASFAGARGRTQVVVAEDVEEPVNPRDRVAKTRIPARAAQCGSASAIFECSCKVGSVICANCLMSLSCVSFAACSKSCTAA